MASEGEKRDPKLFYTDDEIAIFRQQLKEGGRLAMEELKRRGVTGPHPRVRRLKEIQNDQ